ncbi:MAG: UDP-N-acetylmuramate:L-alanyl-gamma-D-glutamyl-meso-diaminopimelate ligase [Methylococcaceae bacterium]|nr:MAG: UDP-N-acetylmuramate:L-alanyl-gamma-D-glutamyl-meso-diaminopimelate ligase [Methylococcaceae bacterium]
MTPSPHIHILGICGTFMGGLAVLAQQLGYRVSGSDQNVYPPMSSQLQSLGVCLMEGYRAENLDPAPDLVVVGNALSRGNAEVEAVLNRGLPYVSGPQWLYEHVLKDRWVLAVAGTHGKTTTTSLLTWLLEDAGLEPGFLVGGVPQNFGLSARLGGGRYFVVEADEYDTAFFDKRSKFVHYRPRTAILNNLEYDHADIFPDLAAIQRQFHHLVRSVPGNGLLIAPQNDAALAETLGMGCWTPVQYTGLDAADTDWSAQLLLEDGSRFAVRHGGRLVGQVSWNMLGRHNVMNALSAIAAACHAGVEPAQALQSLSRFDGVKRRLELRAEVHGIAIYDDFAHHPTAVHATLQALRAKAGEQRIIAVLEPRSNTMRLGVHGAALGASLSLADQALLYQPPGLGWDLNTAVGQAANVQVHEDLDGIVAWLARETRAGDHVVFMSNGGFGGIHGKVEQALRQSHRSNETL